MKTIGLDISVLNDKQKTGIAVYCYNLIDALLKLNISDRFILFGISTFETFEYLKNLPFKSYPNVEIKVNRLSARAFRTAFLLWQKINWPPIESFVGKVDISHSFNWYLPPQQFGKRVATIYDLTPQLFPKFHLPKTIQLEKVRLERIKQKADLVIAISESTKDDFLKFAPGKKVEVIYPAVSENFFKKIGQGKEILTKYNLENGYILSVGTLEPRKNIKILIEAYLKSNTKRKLVLVGIRGWESSELFELIHKNRDKIIATGFIPDEDLPQIYRQAFCFVYPSTYEGFGIPVLEALSQGVPVICSKNSSLVEAGGEAVIYINPERLESLTDALIKIEDSELRKTLINKGFVHLKKFSWQKSVKKLNLLYQAL